MAYQYYQLKNGIRIVHRQIAGQISHCGLMVDTGSRDEQEQENGMAHFIEHMIFKGTQKRKAYHIISRIENVGGELNAYTSKEETCIYASFLSPYYDRSLEIFADVAFHSTFPEKEIEKEKDVVLDEINSYQDNPAELILDDFEDLLFDGHPLGRNILGDQSHVEAFTKKDIFRFIKRNYDTRKMVISSVGQIDFEKLVRLVRKYFEDIPENKKEVIRPAFENYTPSRKVIQKQSYLSHCLTGNIAFSINHPQKMSLLLLNNLLGGPAMNSRLNLGIREKYGFAYTIESTVQTYSDTGFFGVYLGTDAKHVDKSLVLVKLELDKLRKQKLGTLQLTRAKQQFKGQIALNDELPLNEMLEVAKAFLYKESVNDSETIFRLIDAITAEDILEVASVVFEPSSQSTLIYNNK
ncbi:MAG: insulinase family protein [Bacteroidales bacterium]|nr:insulinase family protein [Bacteroidales bacterium]